MHCIAAGYDYVVCHPHSAQAVHHGAMPTAVRQRGVATSRLGFCAINLRCSIAPRFPAAAIVAAAAPPSLQTYVDPTTLTVGLLAFQGFSSRRVHSTPTTHSSARGCCCCCACLGGSIVYSSSKYTEAVVLTCGGCCATHLKRCTRQARQY